MVGAPTIIAALLIANNWWFFLEDNSFVAHHHTMILSHKTLKQVANQSSLFQELANNLYELIIKCFHFCNPSFHTGTFQLDHRSNSFLALTVWYVCQS